MPKKGRDNNKPREMTKRQLSRWQAQKKRQRIILGVGSTVILAIIVILIAGWYINIYQPLHATAIRVNGTGFNMQYYIDMYRLRAQNQPGQAQANIADLVIRDIEQGQLIQDEAAKLGFSVPDSAVKEKLKSQNLPATSVYRDLVRTQLLAEKVRDEYLVKDITNPTKQANIMAMLLESELQANEVRARLEKGEDFATLAGQLSLNKTTKDKAELGWHPEDVFLIMLGTEVPGQYAFGSEAGVLSQPRPDDEVFKNVGYWLIRVNNRSEASIADVSAMLLGSEAEAKAVKARLAAGDNFTALAKELSQLTTAEQNGGEIGLINQGASRNAVFDNYVYNAATKIGVFSEPLRDDSTPTRGGYWLVKVLEQSDSRPVDDSDMQILKNQALDEWVASLWADPTNQIDHSYLDDIKKSWAAAQATRNP